MTFDRVWTNRRPLLLGIIYLIVVVFPAGMVPLFDHDEGAFAEATREMLKYGDFITTRLNGELRFDKPILIYWFQALSVLLFGINEFAFRLPSVIAGALWGYGLYRFVSRFFDSRKAFLAVLFLFTSIQTNIIMKAAIADSLLNLFLALAMIQIYYHSVYDDEKHIYLTHIFMGLGMLTKGPVAVVIPFSVSLFYYLSINDFGRWVRAVFHPIGLFLFLLITLPWYGAEYAAQGQAFIDRFFLTHNVNRFSTPFEGHAGSMIYYIPVVLLGMFPFTSLFVRSILQSGYERDGSPEQTGLIRFSLIWFLFVLLFFSMSGTKLPHYIVYGYTPLFLLMAVQGNQLKKRIWIYLPSLLAGLTLLFLPELLHIVRETIQDDYAKIVLREWIELPGPTYRITMLLFLGYILLTASLDQWMGEFRYAAIGMSLSLIVNYLTAPMFAGVLQTPVKEAARIAEKLNRPVVVWKIQQPSFSVYSQSMLEYRYPARGDLMFIRENYLPYLDEYEILYQKHGLYLINITRLNKDMEWYESVKHLGSPGDSP